jgi:hypothetical protein
VRRAAALIVLALVATRASADFTTDLDTPILRPLSRAMAVSVAKSLPVPAASSGITFTFNPATSAFERDTEILGQLFLERAKPIGRGKLNFSVTYQYVPTDTFEGKSLHSLSDLRPLRQGDQLFIVPHLDFGLVTHQVTTSVTYGVTDDLEVNLTLPLLQTDLDVHGTLQQLGTGRLQHGTTRDDAFGVGDIFLRGKYRLLSGRFGDLAAGLVFRLPSGNQDDFQGTGLFEVDPRIYATTKAIEIAPLMRLQGFLEAGLDLTPENSARSEGRYGAGFDVLLGNRATLSLAFLAREPFSRLVDPGFLDGTRADGSRSALFGINPGHPSYYDLSIGGRINLYRDTVFLMTNVIVPVNPDGARASVIPLIGIEAAF